MLGVRREELTAAAEKLQQAGFIRNHRSRIVVLDRSGWKVTPANATT